MKMYSVLLSIAVICASLLFYRQWTATKEYWKRRGVPHLPPHLVLGNLTFLQRENPTFWMRRMYERFRSPYVGIWIFWRPALIINSPTIAKNVLIRDSAVFKDRFLSSGKSDPIGSLNLFTVKEPLWYTLRRRLTVVFTAHRLRALHALTTRKSMELLQRIQNEIDQNKRTDMRTMFADFTTDVIGCAAFGLASDATLTGHSSLRSITKGFMRYSLLRGLSWSSIFFFPDLVDIFRFSFFPKRESKLFTKIFQIVVAKRGGYDRKVNEPKDLLDALLKIQRESIVENEGISEEILIAQAAIFLLGGFDTSAVVLTFAIYELSFQPLAQDKMYEEILDAYRQHENDELDTKTLEGLKFMNSVIKETLRKYSSMGWLDRIASQDYKIDDNLTISAGTPLYVNAIGMHYDPELFPEPNKFHADRFLSENEKNIKPFTYMPFGEGPRNCIGKRFGLQTVRYALAAIFLHYEVHPLPGAPKPCDVQIDKRAMFLTPGEQLYVKYVPRNRNRDANAKKISIE